jgi:hypothetical protein
MQKTKVIAETEYVGTYKLVNGFEGLLANVNQTLRLSVVVFVWLQKTYLLRSRACFSVVVADRSIRGVVWAVVFGAIPIIPQSISVRIHIFEITIASLVNLNFHYG